MSGTMSSISITFLGTASAQPSPTRSHSSLALRVSNQVWLFDCGEGTQLQIQKSNIKLGKISKIFITHTHGDHIFGLVPLLSSRLNGAGGTANGVEDPRAIGVSQRVEIIEIYGPLGTRAYVRAGLAYTHTHLDGLFVVHELRFPSDPAASDGSPIPMNASECTTGRNIAQVDGIWPKFYEDAQISISAAPILHSAPCIGYVITELSVPGKMDPKQYIPHIRRTNSPMSIMGRLQQGETIRLKDGTILHGPARRPGRKLVILGDTYDPSPIAGLALNTTLLIHEATNAHLPAIDPSTRDDDDYESVETRTKSRGHSTPQMAGSFATRIKAKGLILNHFSARYGGDDDVDTKARALMKGIASLAAEKFAGPVICARDLMSIEVGFPE